MLMRATEIDEVLSGSDEKYRAVALGVGSGESAISSAAARYVKIGRFLQKAE